LTPDTAIAPWFRTPRGIHSARMVNDRFPSAADLWFQNGGYAGAATSAALSIINRKFTPNRIFAVFCKFSPNLLQ
jgi:hypothetical protein